MKQRDKCIALFDFDGTLTKKDSLFEVIKFIRGRRRFYWGMILSLPSLILYKLKIISNWEAKERLLTLFFGGIFYSEFQKECHQFALNSIPGLLRVDAMATLTELKQRNFRIVVVTASAEDWVKPWCDSQHIECIGTRLQIFDQKITGKIQGFNCSGKEKVARIKAKIELSEYKEIYSYGDSQGDTEMLALASKPYYKVFHK